MNPEATNIIDGHLQDLKYMVEFAAELSEELDGNGARKAISRKPATGSPFAATIRFAASTN